jgi:hypothetical protein
MLPRFSFLLGADNDPANVGIEVVDNEGRKLIRRFGRVSVRDWARGGSGTGSGESGVAGADFEVSGEEVDIEKGLPGLRLLSFRSTTGSSLADGAKCTAEVDCESGEGWTVLCLIGTLANRERPSPAAAA